MPKTPPREPETHAAITVNPDHNDNVHLSAIRKTFSFVTVSTFITAHLRKFTGIIMVPKEFFLEHNGLFNG